MRRNKQGTHGDERKDAHEQIEHNIVDYLMKNVYLQNKIQFYMSVDVKVLQTLLSIAFRPGQLSHEARYFVINLLKKYTFIINIAFTDQKLCHQELFSFLKLHQYDYELLNAFEDIYLPFQSTQTLSRFLSIISHNLTIKQTFINNIYNKQIFKVLYTAVFCCQAPYENDTQAVSQEIIRCLVDSIFEYSPRPQEKQANERMISYGTVTLNLKDFLSDLTINIGAVELDLVHKLIVLINQTFIQKMLANFRRLGMSQQYEQYCQGIIYICINILKLLQSFKLSNTQYGQKDKSNKLEIQKLLCRAAASIASKLDYLIKFLPEKSNESINFSSGERVERVGLLGYSILELIQKILSINQIQDLQIKFQTFDFFIVVQAFLEKYRWNNVVHNVIFKIVQHLLSQDYGNFKKRYLQNGQNHKRGLLGSLIMHFRNRKFIFLHSMHMINQGHLSFIFRISKILINQMQQRNDLNQLIDSFRIWKQFMQVDLKEYQAKNYQQSRCFDISAQENCPKIKVKYNGFNTPDIGFQSNKPLQTIEEILKHFKEEQKWSPKRSPNSIRKSNLLNNQMIQKMDSLPHYQPLNQ